MENDKGQELAEDSNLRAGFSTHGVLFGHLGYYVNPEYRYSEDTFAGDDDRIDILEGYGKLEVFNIEFEAGRDSLWWGTGRHGSLILTDNAQPFDLVKISNPRPVLLPWIFKYLGLFKFVGFWTELENSRVVPEAEVLGMRFHFKPLPFFDIGFSRTIMMGGKGGPKGIDELDLDDWGTILSGRNIEGDLNTNQIGGLDIDLLIPNVDAWLPIMESINLWGEWYGEDEAGSLPSKGAYVGGLKLGDLFLTGRTDLIFEYATNVIGGRPGLWYSHSVYRTGYRYEGEIMGHNMGSDARDYFVRLEHYLRPELILSLDYNRQERGVEAEVEEQRDRYDFDLTYQRSDTLVLRAGYRYESIDNFRQVQGKDRDNNIFWLFVDYSF
ncbi:MAG: capsule assembly Wzi family protein [Syntrophobacteria bacterium]